MKNRTSHQRSPVGSFLWIVALTVGLVVLGFAQDNSAMGSPGPKLVMRPDSIHVYWAYSIDPMTDTVFIGNFDGGHTAGDVNPASLMLNSTVPSTGFSILPGMPGFDGEVFAAYFSLKDFVFTYPPLVDTTRQYYNVAGQFNSSEPFAAADSITIIGKKPGDLNCDGRTNVTDVVFLVTYVFGDGPGGCTPSLLDVDGSCQVDVGDAVYLVRYVFGAGPKPMAPCSK